MNHCLLCHEELDLHWSSGYDYEYFSSNDKYDYLFCPKCDCLSIDEPPVKKLKLIYPENYYSFNEAKQNFILKIKESFDKFLFKKILKNFNCPTLSVLDIGGGTGWLLTLLKSCDARIKNTLVVDIDSQSESLVRQRGHEYFCGELKNLENKNLFDLILCLNLIEHVADPKELLCEIRKRISHNGRVLIKTPNFKSFDAKLFRKSYWGGLHCPRHWVLFSEKSITKIARDAGFEVLSLKYTQGATFWATSILTFMRKKKLIYFDKKLTLMEHFLYKPVIVFFAFFDLILKFVFRTSQMIIILKPS